MAVSNIEEALQLRFSGVFIPILILGYTNPVCVEAPSKYDISQCVFSKEYADLISQYAIKSNIRLKIHLKIDTGMGRIGFRCKGVNEHNLADAIDICRYPCFITEGIFTHFSVSDEVNDGYQYTTGNMIILGLQLIILQSIKLILYSTIALIVRLFLIIQK